MKKQIYISLIIFIVLLTNCCCESIYNDGQQDSFWGDPIPWEEARKLFPAFVVGTLTDVETKERFQVVRRGGRYHADIQPLTSRDSAVLKDIYNGEWSWKRRAVIVEIGGKRIAGSINGMPHGGGKIKNNDFNGHFCLHFFDCKVHKSKKIDLAHQMMVWKAAGKPEEPYLKATPKQVITLVITAINQRDGGLASLGLYSREDKDIYLSLLVKLRQITDSISIERLTATETEENGPKLTFKVRISYYHPVSGKKEKAEGVLNLIRNTEDNRWVLSADDLLDLIINV